MHSDLLDDMKQAGAIGLMEAARRFEPSRGIKFWTFARTRVLGAVIDLVVRPTLGREGYTKKVRLQQVATPDDEQPMAFVPGDAAEPVEGQVARVRASALTRLSRLFSVRTAKMLVMHVFDRKVMRIVAEAFGLTESRVCQILQPEMRERARLVIETEVAREAAT